MTTNGWLQIALYIVVLLALAIPADSIRALVARLTEGRTFGLLGEPRVNVGLLNLALDRLTRSP